MRVAGAKALIQGDGGTDSGVCAALMHVHSPLTPRNGGRSCALLPQQREELEGKREQERQWNCRSSNAKVDAGS